MTAAVLRAPHSLPSESDSTDQPHSASHILVVDDDLDVREALCEVLDDDGYQVSSAINGADALAQLASGLDPDLIVLDWKMPVMDGYGFLAKRAADPVLARIPVIVVSATVDDRVHTIDAFPIRKPINLSHLLREIEQRIRSQRDLLGGSGDAR